MSNTEDRSLDFETLAVRAGQHRTAESEHAEPIFATSSYVFESAAAAAARLICAMNLARAVLVVLVSTLLLSLRAFYHGGKTPQQADELGRQVGMTKWSKHVFAHMEAHCGKTHDQQCYK